MKRTKKSYSQSAAAAHGPHTRRLNENGFKLAAIPTVNLLSESPCEVQIVSADRTAS